MLQFRYLDKRLKFTDIAPYLAQIYGGQNAHELIWTPTVYVANERTSAVMGNGVKDLLISISSYGMVMLNTRYIDIYNISKRVLLVLRIRGRNFSFSFDLLPVLLFHILFRI